MDEVKKAARKILKKKLVDLTVGDVIEFLSNLEEPWKKESK